MPTYGYRCADCGHTFEVFQSITEKPLAVCEKCGGRVKRLLYPVGIVFKGSGFHVNDYGKHGAKPGGNGDKSPPKSEDKRPAEAAKS